MAIIAISQLWENSHVIWILHQVEKSGILVKKESFWKKLWWYKEMGRKIRCFGTSFHFNQNPRIIAAFSMVKWKHSNFWVADLPFFRMGRGIGCSKRLSSSKISLLSLYNMGMRFLSWNLLSPSSWRS